MFWWFPLPTGTSVLAGIAIFSILGHMAHIYRKPIGEVVKEGQSKTEAVFRKRKPRIIILRDLLWSFCRVRPRFYCISRGFNPAAHFPFMVHPVFFHAFHHWRGLSVHSHR